MSRPATVPRGRHAPPPEIRQGHQRDRLFAAAAAVFARVGHADASAEAIAREAGMSKATFYEHFDNKDHCLIALVDEAHDGALREFERIRGVHASLSKSGCVFATIRDFLRVLDDYPEVTRTVLSVAAGAAPRARARRDAIFDSIAGYIHAEVDGVATFEDAYALVVAGFGLVERRLRTGEPADLDALDPVLSRLTLAAAGEGMSTAAGLAALERDLVGCRRCPRLVAWREQVARERRAAYRDETYWGRPVPGFGDPAARILLFGLAPAAHGANRTGRMFTGDRSGDFLYAALHRAGLAAQPTSVARGDGQALHGVWISAAVRCAPPQNKPLPQERADCEPWAVAELGLLDAVRVTVCLGSIGWEAALRARAALPGGSPVPRPRPRFGHGAEAPGEPWPLLGCFHPSQQNTFTGKLTPAMLDDLLRRAKQLAAAP